MLFGWILIGTLQFDDLLWLLCWFKPVKSYSFVKALKVEHIEIGRRKRRASLLLVSSDKGKSNQSFMVSNEDLARLKLLAPMDESTEENLWTVNTPPRQNTYCNLLKEMYVIQWYVTYLYICNSNKSVRAWKSRNISRA